MWYLRLGLSNPPAGLGPSQGYFALHTSLGPLLLTLVGHWMTEKVPAEEREEGW